VLVLEPAGTGEPTGADPVVAEADPEPVADVLELLLQAAAVSARATPSAGAIIRRAKRSNRMTRLLLSRSEYC
jgi:hypothetical protein